MNTDVETHSRASLPPIQYSIFKEMTLFRHKYRVESTRLKNWDYAAKGAYFITLCTKNRECLFGEITNNEMQLNHCGECVRDEWLKSFQLRSELFCDIYVIMPNHIHGIVVIHKSSVETHGCASLGIPHHINTDAKTHGRASLRNGISIRQKKSISSFIAGFKSAATKRINEFRQTPGLAVWQPRFYEHIIRNDDDLNQIREYIDGNPKNWLIDENYFDQTTKPETRLQTTGNAGQ